MSLTVCNRERLRVNAEKSKVFERAKECIFDFAKLYSVREHNEV